MKLNSKINELKDLIGELESEDLDLDTAINKYQKALITVKDLFQYLNKKEEEITILKKEGDALISRNIKIPV
ncbi:MAG: exodeoxyribonuclease VII small subunit [Candidatus Margulisiibacteriota bacterium]|jgi:exodeoxyribonuclease VII small subunit